MTIYVIEARKTEGQHHWQWIAGVFNDEKVATEYFNGLSKRPETFNMVVLEGHSYPLIINETWEENKGLCFQHLTPQDAWNWINKIQRVDDEEYCYGNLYYIEADYEPTKIGAENPGDDYMGAIYHRHIDNWAIDGAKSDLVKDYGVVE